MANAAAALEAAENHECWAASGSIGRAQLDDLFSDLGVDFDSEAVRAATVKALARWCTTAEPMGVHKANFMSWWETCYAPSLPEEPSELDETLHELRLFSKKRACPDVHTAAWAGDLALVKLFIEEDEGQAKLADGTDQTLGGQNTPLHYAAYQGHMPVLRALLEVKCVDPSATNAAGCTPLFLACQQGQLPAVQELLDQGDKKKALAARCNGYRFSPVDVATPDVRALLLGLDGSLAPTAKTCTDARLGEEGTDTLTVSWQSKPPGCLPLSGFRLRLKAHGEWAAGEAPPAVIQFVGADCTEACIRGLQPDTAYCAEVGGVNLAGAGPYCPPCEPVRTLARAPVLMGSLAAEEGYCGTEAGGNHVTVAWKWHWEETAEWRAREPVLQDIADAQAALAAPMLDRKERAKRAAAVAALEPQAERVRAAALRDTIRQVRDPPPHTH